MNNNFHANKKYMTHTFVNPRGKEFTTIRVARSLLDKLNKISFLNETQLLPLNRRTIAKNKLRSLGQRLISAG